jgi:hypothetical protein
MIRRNHPHLSDELVLGVAEFLDVQGAYSSSPARVSTFYRKIIGLYEFLLHDLTDLASIGDWSPASIREYYHSDRYADSLFFGSCLQAYEVHLERTLNEEHAFRACRDPAHPGALADWRKALVAGPPQHPQDRVIFQSFYHGRINEDSARK